jgi:S-formylglutathione hydrolase FrmB
MRRAFAVCLFFVLIGSLAVQAGPLTICGKFQIVKLNAKLHGCVLDFTHNHRDDRRFYSQALECKRDMYVYLPPGFDPAQRYPLMIWLHGFLQDEKDFLDLAPLFDCAIADGSLPPMIIACPDGSIRGRPNFIDAGSFYLNSRVGRFEDYLAVDVWDFLVSNFPIRPEAEAHILAGGSMGGYSAYNHAIKYRDRYKVVAGFLPPLNWRYVDCHGRYFSDFDPDCIGWAERYRPHATIGVFFRVIKVQQKHMIDPLYGRNRQAVAQSIAAENPVEMLEIYDVKPKCLNMFIGYGGADEFNIGAQVESFLHFAKKRGIEPEVVYDPHGNHRTATGTKMLPQFAAWIKPLLKSYAPPLKLSEPVQR